MADNQVGKPIPKIVGRGKNRLKRPYSSHAYSLRSTVTRCQSSNEAPCSFCSFYRTSHDELTDYNFQLRTQLLKTTTRALVIERWRRQKEEKVKKLRGLLQDRANELRDKNVEVQQYLREARLRQEELQHTVTQLQQSKEEVADLHTQLEHERKKIKTMEEFNHLEKKEVKKMKESLRSLINQLSPLLQELKEVAKCYGNATDSDSVSARLESIQETLTHYRAEVSIENEETEAANICSSQTLINKIIIEVICGVCHEMFIDPVALPCGHVLCEFCIRMWFKRCRGCPICRQRILSCAQLHAIYPFRDIIGLLNKFRTPEEQDSRTEEMSKRIELREELYSDPLPRRVRERPSSSSDRRDQFTHRRRRLDHGVQPVPYPIPLPDSTSRPPARLDILPPQPPRNIHPPFLPPNPFFNQDAQAPSSSGPDSQRNIMTMLLNQTFSSIDRFIRGGPNDVFPIRGPLNMIEFTPEGLSNVGETMPGIEDVQSTSGGNTNQTTVAAQFGSPEIGTPQNPIIVPDHASEEDLSSRTPPGTPPDVYRSIISDSSDEIWPNNPVDVSQFMDAQTSHQERPTPPQPPLPGDLVDIRDLQQNIVADEVALERNENLDGELQPLLDGEFLSSSSRSDTTDSETETETETESETDMESEQELAASTSLDAVD